MKKGITLIILILLFITAFSQVQEKVIIMNNILYKINIRTITQKDINSMAYINIKNKTTLSNGRRTGFLVPTKEQLQNILGKEIIVTSITPLSGYRVLTSYDNSTSNSFPPIGNQKGEGSCTCWAIGYYSKTFAEAKEHNWDLSSASWDTTNNEPTPSSYQNYIMSPDFIYHQICGGTDNGSYDHDALELLKRIGCSSWAKMPYDDSQINSFPSEIAYREGIKYRNNDYYYIDISNDSGIKNVKNVISSGILVNFAIDANEFSNFDSNDLLTEDTYTSTATNHMQTIVGYDDDYSYTVAAGTKKGAFKIVNSWGQGGWENVKDGFYWITYEAFKKLGYHWAFYSTDKTNYTPSYIAIIHLSHSARGDLIKTFKNGIVNSVNFDYLYMRGGNLPYPNNDIVYDISDIIDSNRYYTINIYDLKYNEAYPYYWCDTGTSTIGNISKFSIEDYFHGGNYDNNNPYHIYQSTYPTTQTINGNTITLGINFNDAPLLAWSGNTGFTNDGVEPNTATTSTTFTFEVSYADQDNDSPTITQVWIDLNNSNTYEDNEKFNMTKINPSDTTYTDGSFYSFKKYIRYFKGNGIFNYKFYFSDGYSQATGTPTQNHTLFIENMDTTDNIDNLLVYPNPIILKNQNYITFTNLDINSIIKIYSLSGELVFTYTNSSGVLTYDWYLKNNDNNLISSGIYIYTVSDGKTTKMGKIAILK